MHSKDIPDHLLIPISDLFQKCKNAEKGTRLTTLQAEIKASYPELSETDLKSVSQITAKLIIEREQT